MWEVMLLIAGLLVGLVCGKEMAQQWYVRHLKQMHRDMQQQSDELIAILDRSTKSNEVVIEQSLMLKDFLIALNDLKDVKNLIAKDLPRFDD